MFSTPNIRSRDDQPPNDRNGEQGAGANRRGCPVVGALRSSDPPARFHAHPRPGGRHSLIVRHKNPNNRDLFHSETLG